MSENDLNNTSNTNWDALESMSDEDIDYSDIPPLTDEFFESATLRIPSDKARHLIQIDPDVIAWFKAQDTEYKTLINTVLRRYIESNGDKH
ncbi:BrnA antitoxin family protein [Coleofasciculus chthonoplastes]|uniref:BrnA antitoxin family protein n=1 Tax=Coleofasciculus chthonoplastes TaxID=64178 RepID=UPI0005C7013B|nr:BrnA antitoxin family protein [Coleofasciculus chthonoplastes]